MTGYFDKLNKWAADKQAVIKIETADNDLARWVTIRRYDGMSATGYGQTYDEAAVSAYHLYQERRSYC